MNKTRIKTVTGRQVWDSRGRPTLEVEIELRYGALGRAIAPSGASTGSGEARERRDGGARFGGLGVDCALEAITGEIAAALKGADAADQAGIDRILIELDGTPNKERLGGNAIIATSMAAAHAAASAEKLPLWRYLEIQAGNSEPKVLPLPEIQIFGGGAHAGGRIDVQDFMVVAIGASSYGQALEWTSEIYRAAGAIMSETGRLQGVADEGGYWPAFQSNEDGLEATMRASEAAGLTPGQDIGLSLDIAASQFGRGGRYRLACDDCDMDSDELSGLLADWIERYPIVSIEDPLAEDDPEGLSRFTWAVGKRVQVVGDDFLVTNAERIKTAAAQGICNTVLIKPNQAGTLSEASAALDAARKTGYGTIVSARSGETEDVTIVHLAVGWCIPQIKVGSFARSERTAKWNEGLRIAGAMTRAGSGVTDGALPPRSGFPWRN